MCMQPFKMCWLTACSAPGPVQALGKQEQSNTVLAFKFSKETDL